MDLGCYPLNWALSVMDEEPTDVEARASLTRGGVDETMDATLAFEGGATATLHCSMTSGVPFETGLTITGTEGMIRFDNPLLPHQGGTLCVTTQGQERNIPISPISTYTWQLAAVVNALQTGEGLPTEGEAILRQQRLLDAIYSAAELGELRAPA